MFKDHTWEENNLVFVQRWSLIAGSFMQKMSYWKINSVVAKDRELLYKGCLKHRFDFTINENCLSFLVTDIII